MIIIANSLIGLGLFFMVFGTIGLLRFPDLYTRLHPAGKAGTAGIISIFLGLMLYAGSAQDTLRIFLIVLFTLITSPVASHAIARGAIESGIEPWQRKKK